MLLRYIDQFRALAIIMIVAGHVWFLMGWDQNGTEPRFIAALAANGTLPFVFIAGFLFKYLMPKFEAKKYYLSKLRNVIAPYILISIPAIILVISHHPGDVVLPPDFYSWNVLSQVTWLYLTGDHLIPLWFIPMIAIIYLIAPLLVVLDRDGRFYYAVPVLFAASLFLHRPTANVGPLHAFLFYLPIYLIGMWTARNVEAVLAFVARWKYVLWLAFAILVLMGTFLLERPDNTFANGYFVLPKDVISWIRIQKTILVFLMLYYLNRYETRIGDRLHPIADASFGIYFVHYYVIAAIEILTGHLGIKIGGGVIVYLALTAGVCAVSFLIVRTVKALAGPQSRLVIGS